MLPFQTIRIQSNLSNFPHDIEDYYIVHNYHMFVLILVFNPHSQTYTSNSNVFSFNSTLVSFDSCLNLLSLFQFIYKLSKFTTTYCAVLRRAKQKIWRFCERKTKNLKGLQRKKNLPNLRCRTHRNLWRTTHHKFRINL
jgi:hypothetical protein